MDHKEFFRDHGGWFVTGTSFTFDDLCEAIEGRLLEKLSALGILDYQSVKARLIEELRVTKDEVFKDGGWKIERRLIDTTGGANG